MTKKMHLFKVPYILCIYFTNPLSNGWTWLPLPPPTFPHLLEKTCFCPLPFVVDEMIWKWAHNSWTGYSPPSSPTKRDQIFCVPSPCLWSLLAVLQLVQAQTNLCELGHNSQLGTKHKIGTYFQPVSDLSPDVFHLTFFFIPLFQMYKMFRENYLLKLYGFSHLLTMTIRYRWPGLWYIAHFAHDT